MERCFSNGRRLIAEEGDITKVTVDAIVNAANSYLAGGGGVDGAIHRVGGPQLMRELDVIRKEIGRCPTGSAVVTTAGQLSAQYVFHAVGPVYEDGKEGEPEELASCYRTCLALADERKLRSIAFPAISTGVYGYPMEAAAAIAVGEVAKHLGKDGSSIEEARFVLFGAKAFKAFSRALTAAPIE